MVSRTFRGLIGCVFALALPCASVARAQAQKPAAPHIANPNQPKAPPQPQNQPQQLGPIQTAPPLPPGARQLITDVEGAYARGVASYRAGKVTDARTNFDLAVDMMLTSNQNIRGTPALSDEFDKIIEGINNLEMANLERGEGLTARVDISPAEEANDVTFPVDPNLRARAEAELKNTYSALPLVINDPVASFISFFTNNRSGRATLTHSLERAGRYRDMIERIFREEGVPPELIYQAVAESGFQPKAVNAHSGAGGMWQFMPATGAHYGLTRNAYVDERFDPEKATRAYAKYMKAIYDQLGDWYLVMAGYDWGEGAVQHAVGKTGYADFWELYRRNNLPQETKNYVPIILAAVIIAKNPAQYGFADLHPLPALAFDDVTTHTEISLRLAADVTGADLDEMVQLNPGLLRLATPHDQDYTLHLPPGTKDLFTRRIALIPPNHLASWRFHSVRAGESLTDIARNYHSDAAEIAQANQITGAQMVEGQELVVPEAVVAYAPPVARVAQTYKVRHGESLVSVADRFGVTTAQLRAWNGLKTNVVPAGKLLRVSSPSLGHAAGKSRSGKGGPTKKSGKGR